MDISAVPPPKTDLEKQLQLITETGKTGKT